MLYKVSHKCYFIVKKNQIIFLNMYKNIVLQKTKSLTLSKSESKNNILRELPT